MEKKKGKYTYDSLGAKDKFLFPVMLKITSKIGTLKLKLDLLDRGIDRRPLSFPLMPLFCVSFLENPLSLQLFLSHNSQKTIPATLTL